MKEYEQILEAEHKLPHFQKTIKVTQELPLAYHYRNFQSFWQILKSDSFWATNARFSNDEAEQEFGMEVIASLGKNQQMKDEIGDVGLDENYIVCFCMEDDKLSQWRGYAPEGGVAMGFDFNMPRAFSVLNNDAEDAIKEEMCVVQYVGLDKVRYINPRGEQNDNEYNEYCRTELALINPATAEDASDIYREEIKKKAPYIKHSGFMEENEYRLVFRNDNGQLDKCVRYRDTNDASLRYPYIVAKAALPANRVTACVVRVCIQEEMEEVLVKELSKAVETIYPTLVQGCHLPFGRQPDMDESFCAGCVLRGLQTEYSYQSCRYKYPVSNVEYEYSLYEKASYVVVSQGEKQKEIFEVIHNHVQKFNKREGVKISVWCEGHLPLRKITVGPCINQNNVVEAIRHYCKHTYWLRDVEIAVSKIPFRKSL